MDIIDLQISYEKATGLLELAKGYNLTPETIARQEAYCLDVKQRLDEAMEQEDAA